MPLSLTVNQKALLAELLREGEDVIGPIVERVRWRLFREFEKADISGRIEIGHQVDALAAVSRELQIILNEVNESGRIDRLNTG